MIQYRTKTQNSSYPAGIPPHTNVRITAVCRPSPLPRKKPAAINRPILPQLWICFKFISIHSPHPGSYPFVSFLVYGFFSCFLLEKYGTFSLESQLDFCRGSAIIFSWGISAVGSAPHSHCGGHGFESRILQPKFKAARQMGSLFYPSVFSSSSISSFTISRKSLSALFLWGTNRRMILPLPLCFT